MSINILCVDDDLNILEGYRRTFGRRYNVYLAQGPLQGVDKLQLGPFYSAIISDKNMPLMDGIDFLDFAKHIFPGSVRIMLTGLADEASTLEAVKEGKIQRLLAKPCSVKDLEKVVAEAVASAWERIEEPVAA
jgi:response regulator RpfG family c-di-GMP phosphodiesterase